MKKIIVSIICAVAFVGCKSSKSSTSNPKDEVLTEDSVGKVTTKEPIIEKKPAVTNKNTATLIKLEEAHNTINRSFKTAQIVSEVKYSDPNFDQSVKADIRIEKGKQILITVKAMMFSVAKIYISPDRVSYYEIIKGTHYDGDFDFIKKMLGTSITYNQVENILMGQSIYPLNDQSLELKDLSSNYQLDKKINDFIVSIIVDNKGELKREQIKNNGSVYADLNYKSYQTIKGVVFPKQWTLISSQKHTMNVGLEYEKIDLNTNLNFKYEIPSGSKAIKF